MHLEALDHETYIDRALTLARESHDQGDDPYGSLLVQDDDIVMEAHNRINTDDDIALHPELTLTRRAARTYTTAQRRETVMYTSTAPCPMCATGIVYAELGAVVYSVSGATVAEQFDTHAGIPCRELFDRYDANTTVIGPVAEAKGLAVHETTRD